MSDVTKAESHDGDQNPLTGTKAAPLAAAAKPAVQVTSRRNEALQRRLAPGGNVFGGGTRALPLKEPQRWHTRIENDFADAQQVYRAVHEFGWEPLTVDDLACKPEEVGLTLNAQGYLTRGAQGREVVLKMDKRDYREVERLKTEKNMQGIGSPTKTRTQAAEAAAAAFGPEAGDAVHKHFHGTVTDTKGGLL